MSKLHELASLGQSIWLDYIRRAFLTAGELQQLIVLGLRGVTSNPAIFQKAISGSADYDPDLRILLAKTPDTKALYEALALQDIALAADQLQPIYQATNGKDGFVSLEVSPTLANNTQGTVKEARRLFERLGRPNVMIKVPATPAGLPAIETLIADGINVNVTLIFSEENYRQVAAAYLKGVETLAEHGPAMENGLPLNRIASVASVFISRIDTAVDRALDQVGNIALQGKIAIANAGLIYAAFQEIFQGTRWEKLQAKGAQVQRPLWASTGTKNPLYPDTLYIDRLIAPDTVNTVPPATLNAFLDHGTVSETLIPGIQEARRQVRELAALGIDLNTVTRQLQLDGVAAFTESFAALLASIEEKQVVLQQEKTCFQVRAANYQETVERARQQLRDEEIMARLWRHDHTIWKNEPQEISDRLGWLHSPEVMREAVPALLEFVEDVRQDGFTHALLLGMGGSSLAPDVFRQTFGVSPGYLDLAVLDSTDPDAIAEYTNRLAHQKTLFLVSTKSGGTVETLSFMKHFYNLTQENPGKEGAGGHFVAITDPGSGLEKQAQELGFRNIFLNDPNIGGRFSALSYFGLVPAALVGVDITTLLERAGIMACNCESCNCPVEGNNTGAQLGALMGSLAQEGRDKITFILSPKIASFGAWLEQLIAESTGKEGRGILPVVQEAVLPPPYYSNDRIFVHLGLENDGSVPKTLHELAKAGHPVVFITLQDVYDLGGEFFRWEVATALAGYFLHINPFDQPNVESAKILARKMVAEYQGSGRLPEPEPTLVDGDILVYGDVSGTDAVGMLRLFLTETIATRGMRSPYPYIALQAYVKPDALTWQALQSLRQVIQKKFKLATTLGYGPRFLHSTGQLHKGDSGNGIFVQITSRSETDISIPDAAGSPESSMSFGVLKMAQALGDRQALVENGRAVIWLHFERNLRYGLNRLAEGLS